ncbi:phosphoglycerate kinase [Odoribacter sp. OttesenSCG-928-L07]|nr:phosphoglycerate kinase [Odoribacter sp. OttesenSCG-928-L07]MDL2239080.1 phosphoglycerate kinase [Bacteroidales bacterium OttesenSCG-928-L14]MDL2239993.1 phosphoglycerate kinase [Bacteroidales bacterium OttesenSCG-928-K22]
MKTINDFNFNGMKVLVRVDFNVPLNDKFEITSTNRIDAALPTINKILNDGGAVILMSHLGRPKNGPEEKFSLKHLVNYLQQKLNTTVLFADDCVGESAVEKANNLQKGEILLLENLRFHKEEEKGDEAFAKELALLGDFYVNDAFGTAHRAHASTTIIAHSFDKNHKAFGLLMAKEVEALENVMTHAKHPFTAILGGAKVSDKISLVENLINKTNNIIIGGGMMFTFVKALGGKIGNSLVEEDYLETAKKVLQLAKEKSVNIYVPVDVIAADKFAEDANTEIMDADNIKDGWMGLDIGPKSEKDIEEIIMNSKTILWNGPMGVFEMEKFSEGTRKAAEAVAKATENGAYSLVGGGDSVSAVKKYKLTSKISYISTGGGAMLEYIEGKKLPGVEALL